MPKIGVRKLVTASATAITLVCVWKLLCFLKSIFDVKTHAAMVVVLAIGIGAVGRSKALLLPNGLL